MIYPLLRRLLFLLDPETAHYTALHGLSALQKIRLANCIFKKRIEDPVEVMGLTFPNRVGLAAGYDRNGDFIQALACLGFAFIEVGTATPDPWAGKPRPRVFRLPKHRAVINRFGFANKGLAHMLEQLRQRQYDGVLGVNIVKNVETANQDAVPEYCHLLREVYPYVDYVAVNISSPNTEGLRELQGVEYLVTLLTTLKELQAKLSAEQQRYVPLVVKVAPDLTLDEVQQMSEAFLQCDIDGVISGNTSIAREMIADDPMAKEQGGLSGAPIFTMATERLSQFKQQLGDKIPLIGCGGIMSGDDALKKIDAGASLVQVYNGLIYRGPSLIPEIAKAIHNKI